MATPQGRLGTGDVQTFAGLAAVSAAIYPADIWVGIFSRQSCVTPAILQGNHITCFGLWLQSIARGHTAPFVYHKSITMKHPANAVCSTFRFPV